MNDFCSQKGIKREFSNARTPQQNGVAERRNRTLIEVARIMLADAKLLVTFWAEAVNTACYVQNRVLVNKSYNKTPYELFNGKTPAIGFLKPFGCHIMILITLDNLGKFEAKGDEGYFIGYSMSSKAFRVFNKRTKKVEENLHVEFLENKAIEKGVGLNWLFDIDSLTKSMNYVPVVVGTNSTNLSSIKDAASQEVKKYVSSLRYISLPNWVHDALLESSSSKPQDDCSTDVPESSRNFNPTATPTNPSADQMETLTVETPIPTVSLPVPTACFTNSQEPSSDTRLISKRVANQVETPSLDNILILTNWFEDIFGVTTNSDESNGVEADVSNMETTITASPTPTLRIHKDHPKSQIIGHVDTPIQTRNKSTEVGSPKRLMAQGHTQEEGIDYNEVFAPVARIEAIGLFLAYASFMDFTVYQMDVKSAFLYGTIDEEVYVMQPPRFQDLKFLARVYKVKKAMYGLHQAPRAWHQVTPKECHMHAVKMIFRYLKGHPKLGLCYHKECPFNLIAYSDSDYGGATQDRKSTTGGCQFLGRRLISWQCKKQTIMATSTTEAGYVTAISCCGQVLWIQISCLIMVIMARLAFCDYHNIVAILEKSEHNVDFHSIVDFVEASHLRYALTFKPTVYVSHIRQFWSTARIETTKEGTKILATIDGRIVPLFDSMLVPQGEGSGTPTEPHPTPSPELKARVKLLEDREGEVAERSRDDAPIKGRSLDEGEEVAEKGSNDTEEMINVLTSIDAATVLSSGVAEVATGCGSIPTAGPHAAGVPTGSDVVPTAGLIFATATVVTPYTRRKGKERMIESKTPKKKKIQEQMDI
uniref:Ribonuclease H-like domain-containing protein n=1 Tax=Tanacetum cinerariifolium TaxID=118510 RepID=A0A699HRX6_TANCI|nr:ribonuclease H-like domain-containing protein [Tanacetum cinerariifolium]